MDSNNERFIARKIKNRKLLLTFSISLLLIASGCVSSPRGETATPYAYNESKECYEYKIEENVEVISEYNPTLEQTTFTIVKGRINESNTGMLNTNTYRPMKYAVWASSEDDAIGEVKNGPGIELTEKSVKPGDSFTISTTREPHTRNLTLLWSPPLNRDHPPCKSRVTLEKVNISEEPHKDSILMGIKRNK